MGVFYRSADRTPVLKAALETALKTQPSTVQDFGQLASKMAAQVKEQTPKPKFSWARFGLAILLLALLGGLGMWSATKPALVDWSKAFLHSFEVVLGGMLGLLGFESRTA